MRRRSTANLDRLSPAMRRWLARARKAWRPTRAPIATLEALHRRKLVDVVLKGEARYFRRADGQGSLFG